MTLAPLFTIAGIAVGSAIVSKLMEEYGQGSKVVFVKIVAYCACGYIAFDAWWDLVGYVATSFGVSL